MQNSEIIDTPSGTVFSGPDATRLYACASLKGFIGLYAKCGMIPTRGVTITKMLTMATNYTGKKYKANAAGYAAAQEDLRVWCETMKAALPRSSK